jgi:hypothetical protein
VGNTLAKVNFYIWRQFFKVTGCFFVVQLWIHPTLLHLLPIPIIYSLIKSGFRRFALTDKFRDLGKRILDVMSKWTETRLDVIVPKPARFVWSELGRLKRAVLQGWPLHF